MIHVVEEPSLAPVRPAAPAADRLTSQSGAYAELDGPPDAETIKVFSTGQELLFEYDPATGKTRVNIPTGDLEIVTQQGDIEFASAGNVRFRGQSIEMAARWGIRLAVLDVLGRILSSAMLQPRRMKFSSPQIGITGQRADIQVEETRYTGKKCVARIGSLRLIVDRLETVANCAVEKAKNVYRTVTGLLQVRAGRKRTVVDGSYHLKANAANLKAKESFKIDGEKIHIG